MSVPSDYRFLPSHEWASKQGDLIVVGITQNAADALTDVTHVELPKVGSRVTKGAVWGEVESVKATSDLYAPVSGEVVEVNGVLDDKSPNLVNDDPYKGGWMIKIRPSNPAEFDSLLDAKAYEAQG